MRNNSFWTNSTNQSEKSRSLQMILGSKSLVCRRNCATLRDKAALWHLVAISPWTVLASPAVVCAPRIQSVVCGEPGPFSLFIGDGDISCIVLKFQPFIFITLIKIDTSIRNLFENLLCGISTVSCWPPTSVSVASKRSNKKVLYKMDGRAMLPPLGTREAWSMLDRDYKLPSHVSSLNV